MYAIHINIDNFFIYISYIRSSRRNLDAQFMFKSERILNIGFYREHYAA